MNIRKFKIINYKVVEESEFHFEEGKVYLLRGPNQSGKSTVIEALAKFIGNNNLVPLKDYMKEGATYTRMEATLSDGTLMWRQFGVGKCRGIQYPDGQVVEDPVLSDKQWIDKLQEIVGENESLNCRTQESRLLFKDTSPSSTYKIFTRTTGTDTLLDCISVARGKVKEKEADYFDISNKITIEQSSKPVLPNISPQQINNIDKIIFEIDKYEKFKEYIEIDNKVKEYENETKLSITQQEVEEIEILNTKYKYLKKLLKIEKELNSLDDVFITEKEVRDLEITLKIYNKLDEYLCKEQEIENIKFYGIDEEKIKEFELWGRRIKDAIAERTKYSELFREMESARKVYEEIQKTAKICSTCGQEIEG